MNCEDHVQSVAPGVRDCARGGGRVRARAKRRRWRPRLRRRRSVLPGRIDMHDDRSLNRRRQLEQVRAILVRVVM